MESKDYCDNITEELSGLKSKMDSVVRKFENASPADKKKVASEINELHRITDELDSRIGGIKRDCAGSFK